MSDCKSLLADLGFYRYQEKFTEIKELIDQEVALIKDGKSKLKTYPSWIGIDQAEHPVSQALVIDIGGTSSKAAIRLSDSNHKEKWINLYEIKNLELKTLSDKNHSFELFVEIIANMTTQSLRSVGVNRELPISIGVVWSNAMENYQTEYGIGARVTEISKYTKGEWFIRDLDNGSELSNCFYNAFKKSNLNIENFIIANDTPLTLKATKNATAGVVASTGLNATIIHQPANSSKKLICNTEMGDKIILSELVGTEADYLNPNTKADTIENLTSGLFLPQIFTSYILKLAELGLTELKEIADDLKSMGDQAYKEYRSHDLSLLVDGDDLFIKRRTRPSLYSEAAIKALAILAEALILRAASFCGLSCYLSIANQTISSNTLISLDSRLAREIDIFWAETKSTFYSLDDQLKLVDINLVYPIKTDKGSISAPLIGAANALESLQLD